MLQSIFGRSLLFVLLLLCADVGIRAQSSLPPEVLTSLTRKAETYLEQRDAAGMEAVVAEIVDLCVRHEDYAAALDSGRVWLFDFYYMMDDLLQLEQVTREDAAFIDKYSGRFVSREEELMYRDLARITEGWIAGEMGDVNQRRAINGRLYEEVRNRPDPDPITLLDLLSRLVPDYLTQDNGELAIVYAEAARRLMEEQPELRATSDNLESLLDMYIANAYIKLEDEEQAEQYYQRGIDRILQKEDFSAQRLQGRLTTAYQGLAKLAVQRKDFSGARAYLSDAFAIDRANNWGPSISYYELGRTERAAGRLGAAAGALERSISEEVVAGYVDIRKARSERELAEVYLDQSQPETALEWLQLSLRNLDPEFPGGSPCQNPKDINLVSAPKELLDVLRVKVRAQVAFAAGNPDLLNCALETFRLAVGTLDILKRGLDSEKVRSKLIADHYDLFDQGIALATELGRDQLAFDLAEQSRSNHLLGAVLATSIPDDFLPEAERSRERELKLRIEMARRRIGDAEEQADTAAVRIVSDTRLQLESYYRKLRTDFPDYYQLLRRADADDYREASQSIDPEEALIAYFVGEDNSYGFLMRPGEEVYAFEIPEGKRRLETLTTELLQAIYFGQPPGEEVLTVARGRQPRSGAEADALFADRAYRLHQLLLEPALGQLGEEKKRLLLVPDGVLNYLPFDVLLRDTVPPEEVGYYGNSSYRYVARDHQTSYAYSATLHRLMREAETASGQQGVLFFHDLDFSGQPGSVATAFGNAGFPAEFVEVLNEQGSVEQLAERGRRHQVIHFSVHGVLNGKDPSASYLKLRPEVQEAPEGGSLSLSQLYNLELPVELVFTSACNAGVGQLYEGEGALSLARGFAHAGAKSLVTTLWPVDGGPSDFLMGEFYQRIAEGARKDEALYRGKLALLARSDYAHPYYWAGFVPIGDMRPLSGTGRRFPWWWLAGGLITVGTIYSRRRQLQ